MGIKEGNQTRYRAVAICAGLLFPLNQRLQQVQLSNKLGRRAELSFMKASDAKTCLWSITSFPVLIA